MTHFVGCGYYIPAPLTKNSASVPLNVADIHTLVQVSLGIFLAQAHITVALSACAASGESCSMVALR